MIPRACFIYLCLLLLSMARTLPAQQDVRLSREPLSMILPEDAKIQSADRIGDRTLAVWGTTRLAPDSSVANTLVMQLLRDTALVGPQQVLTSEQARPSGFV